MVDGVYVNGFGPYRFLVDPGSSSNHLEPEIARSIGLTATFRSELVASTGVSVVPGADGIEVSLGSVRAKEQTFLFGSLEAVHHFCKDIQGVLGQEFLSRFDYLLDLSGQRLEIGSPPVNVKGIRMPFRRLNGRPLVSTSLGPMLVDSGTQRVTMFGLRAPPVTGEIISMVGMVRVGTVSVSLLIGGRAFLHGEALAVPLQVEADVAGLLPVSLFRTVYICNSEGYIVFD